MEPHAAAAAGGGGGGEGGRGESPDTGLEGPVWRLGLGGDGGGEGDAARLPERPGEADCGYYLCTGTCGFGERCRYNHPRDRGGTEVVASELGLRCEELNLGAPWVDRWKQNVMNAP